MKKYKNSRYIIAKKMLAILVVLSVIVASPGSFSVVNATQEVTQTEATTQTGSTDATQSGAVTQTSSTEAATNNTNVNGALGKNTDIGIEVTKSVTGKAGKNVKISFVLKSADAASIMLKSVYPVIDDSFPFETSGDAYKVVSAGSDANKMAKLSASYKLKARSDVTSGYQSVQFTAEYSKITPEGTVEDYYVIKTINIYFEDVSSSKNDKDDDDDDSSDDIGGGRFDSSDDDEEVSAPKLIITGYDSDPEVIKAGETFKLTIHIQNTSKTTPVCNGKFLIGNEAGSFLPTSGSNAVFVEKIPAGEIGDLEIEMKASADLSQKNYILVVKGDFDDGKGNNFTSNDNLTIPVQQEVRLEITDVSMSPEQLGIGAEGSLMFTINNQTNVGIRNVRVAIKDDAVTGEDANVGSIAASSSAYATLNVTGVKDNSEKGSITVVISYEDSEGNAGTMEESIPCYVGEDVEEGMEGEWEGEFLEDFEEDDDYGLPVWLIILIVVLVVIVITVIAIILTKQKKKRLAELFEDDDDFDDEELGEDEIKNEDF